jgi:hypothetical protein
MQERMLLIGKTGNVENVLIKLIIASVQVRILHSGSMENVQNVLIKLIIAFVLMSTTYQIIIIYPITTIIPIINKHIMELNVIYAICYQS